MTGMNFREKYPTMFEELDKINQELENEIRYCNAVFGFGRMQNYINDLEEKTARIIKQ